MLIDSHTHLVTFQMIERMIKRFDRIHPGIGKKVLKKSHRVITAEFVEFLKKASVESLAKKWLSELDRNGVDHAIFLPISGALDELDEFVSLHPERFSAYVYLDDPTTKAAVKNFRKRVKSGGFRGLKLYPSIQQVSAADKKMFPLYEAAAELNVPILFHFGITFAPVADYRYTNPMDLYLPSRLFPDTRFIIAHFGAGYFRELLLLGFHAQNIHVDTSGTNNWRLYMPKVPPLKDIFKRTIEVYGAEKVLFGTDSMLNDKAGYRTHILSEQRKALHSLRIKKEDREKILGGNAARIFNIGE